MEPDHFSETQLVDLRVEPRESVPAWARKIDDESVIERIEIAWQQYRDQLGLEHSHWNWKSKLEPVRSGVKIVFGIECVEDYQGLIAIETQPRMSRLTSSQRLIYVDYVEKAPWNIEPLEGFPQLGGIGTELLRIAARWSNQSGFDGRIGLHSLPQSETYYRHVLGMTDLGPDPNYLQLHYFEYNSIDAQRFIKKVSS